MKDDSVSRQAVVDAVKSYWKKVIDDIPKDTGFDEVTKLCDMALEHNSGILKAVDGLPSAQTDVPDTNVGDMISRQAAIDTGENEWN